MKRFNLAKGIFATVFACALILGCLGAVKAKAATTATYNPETDEIEITTDAAKIYYAVGKDGSGVELAPTKFKTADATSDGAIKVNVSAKTGLKVAVNKPVYFYVAEGEPTLADGEKKVKIATPALTINATKIKKAAINIDYSKAASGAADGVAIASIKVTDTDKNDTNYIGTTLEKLIDDGKVLVSADDGKTWAVVSEETLSYGTLYGYITGSTKVKLQFRVLGAANERPSKVAKVSLKKIGKAPKAPKLDIAKMTVAIKNGFDYYIAWEEDEKPSLEGARTILPYNKEGAATKLIVGYDEETGKKTVTDSGEPISIVDTYDFTPIKYNKKDSSTAKYFTKTKYKALPLEELEGFGETIYVYIRKSAAAGKPATLWSTTPLKIDPQADAPDYAEDKLQDAANKVIVSTTGASITASLPTVTSGSAFEYIVVKAADYNTEGKIDWTTAKWTKLTAKVKFTVGKTKSKYAVKGTDGTTGKAQAYTLEKTGSLILIRVAGDKKSGVLPSYWLETTYAEAGTTKTWSIVVPTP